MSKLDHARLCLQAAEHLATLPDSHTMRAQVAVLNEWLQRDQPATLEESVIGLAVAILHDAGVLA